MGELPPGDSSTAPPTVWSVPEPGLHRAMRGGRIVGHVVHDGRHFIAFDAGSTPVGTYRDLLSAQESALARPVDVHAPLAHRWSAIVVAPFVRLMRRGKRTTWRSLGESRSD